MFNFINYIRVIATVLITNSHFGDIWPISALATGGLLGNVLFFAVSGFCLYVIKENFVKWICKRLLRIYPALVLVTLITVLLGAYKINGWNEAINLFVYPTNYIFVVWLMICYVPFYIVAFFDKKHKNVLETSFVAIVILWLITYVVFIDKTNYVVDNVSNPFIMFLYFTSMLIGALFRKNYHKFVNLKLSNVIFLGGGIIIYLASKIAFSKWGTIAPLQIINQFVVLGVAYYFFVVFIGMESKLNKLKGKVNKPIKFLSGLTLQIYLVQFVIINQFKSLIFPLNLLVVVSCILLFATIAYFIEYYLRKFIISLVYKLKNKRVKNDKY